LKPVLLGVVASLFFAVTFILNHAMNVGGGSWIWTASLRFLFMLPFLLLIVISRKNLMPLLVDIRMRFWSWFTWSMIGFGLFYAPIAFASTFEPGWLTAGTWQITIVAGTLLVPFLSETVMTANGLERQRRRLPRKQLWISLIILLGVAVMQADQITSIAVRDVILGILPIVVAAFAFPLGNRKMMEITDGKFDVYQRMLGMTLCSLPFWLLLSFCGLITVGPPSTGQSLQALIVAISSGLVATSLFFTGTDLVRKDVRKLATVEATQAGEVLFTLLGEILLFSTALPSLLSLFGILLVIVGMVLHSLASGKKEIVEVAQSVTEI